MKKYILTIGAKDKDTKKQIYSNKQIYLFIKDTLQKHNFTGFTLYKTRGGYLHNDKQYITETSFRVELMFTKLKFIKPLIKNLKKGLNQETIALEVLKTKSALL